MTLVVKVHINNDPALEVIEARRLVGFEASRMDLDVGGLQYYEVTRYSRRDGVRLSQVEEPAQVQHDPADGAHRLAFLALEATTEGETRTEAWLDARSQTDDKVEEIVADKDAFIERQAEIIQACMGVFSDTGTWRQVPPELYEELRNYV